jgi:hypothetical protein
MQLYQRFFFRFHCRCGLLYEIPDTKAVSLNCPCLSHKNRSFDIMFHSDNILKMTVQTLYNVEYQLHMSPRYGKKTELRNKQTLLQPPDFLSNRIIISWWSWETEISYNE